MIKFFGKAGEYGKQALKNVVTNPLGIASLGVSAAALKVSSDNRKNNRRMRKESDIYNRKQLEVMNRLTNTLTNVDTALHDEEKKVKLQPLPADRLDSEVNRSIFPVFRQKSYSRGLDNYISKIMTGAGLGLAAGGVFNSATRFTKDGRENNKDKSILKSICIFTLVGAALGAFVAAVQEITERNNRKSSGNRRMMESVKNNLNSMGYVLNQDYVLDPVRADRMKTRVSVVISRCSDDLRLVVNMFDDPKLKAASKEIIDGLPKTAHITEKAMNKYNELSISTFSQQGGDAGFIARVIEMFIKRGFPVYITEVG